MVKNAKEASIIEIIQKMVRAGESEEKIVQSLEDLGVEPAKAKRLLVLGQADTFALLRSEIGKIVESKMDDEKSEITKYIERESEKAAEKSKEQLTRAVISDLRQYEKDITGQSKTFKQQINDNVGRVTELSDRVRQKLNQLGQAMRTVQIDMDEMKLRGIGSRNKLITLTLIVLGIMFCLVDLYMFLFTFGGEFTIDSMIITVIMALIGITMLFVATVV